MGAKTGSAIKAARTGAGMTQEQLAKKIKGITAADISKAERGETDLTQAVLKEIAKATGVTQTSLLNAEKSKTGSSKAKTAKTAKSTAKSSDKTEVMLTAEEKKIISLYRKADKTTKASVLQILNQKKQTQELVGNILGEAINMFMGGKE